jgi:hypothetical protein
MKSSEAVFSPIQFASWVGHNLPQSHDIQKRARLKDSIPRNLKRL